jgi:hypothetical protein
VAVKNTHFRTSFASFAKAFTTGIESSGPSYSARVNVSAAGRSPLRTSERDVGSLAKNHRRYNGLSTERHGFMPMNASASEGSMTWNGALASNSLSNHRARLG